MIKPSSKNALYSLLGMLSILMIFDTIVTNIQVKSTLSIFVLPVFFGLLGYRFNFTFFKEISIRELLSSFILKFVIVYLIVTLGYATLVYFTSGITEPFCQQILFILPHSYFRLPLLLVLSLYFIFMFVMSRCFNQKQTLIFGGILSTISLIAVVITSVYTPNGIYLNNIENNIMLYNFIFFIIGGYLKDKTPILEKKSGIRLGFCVVILYLFILFGNEFIGENLKKEWIVVFKFILQLVIYTFNFAFLLILANVIIKWSGDNYLSILGARILGLNSFIGLSIIVATRIGGSEFVYYLLAITLALLLVSSIYVFRNNSIFNKVFLKLEEERNEKTFVS